jgi:hypothetical protein
VSQTYRPQFTTTKTPGRCGDPHFAGVSADGADVFFQSEAALTPEAEETETPSLHATHSFIGEENGSPCQFSCNLYVAADSKLREVNLLPTGQPVPNATFGGASESPPDFSDAVSADGSTAFWTDTQPGPNMEHVYVRLHATQPPSSTGVGGECLVAADACTVPVTGGAGKYWTATPDGRFAFYTEEERLWRFDTRDLTRVPLASEGINTGEDAGVQGVIGTNQTGEDGAYVYLVATGVLASNESPNGEQAETGADNLYLIHGAATSFIAKLAPADNEVTASGQDDGVHYGAWHPNLGSRTAEVTPDGRHLVFESTRAITGYNNDPGSPGNPVLEAFVYSAGTGEIACASCLPSGAAPKREGTVAASTLLPVSFSDTRMHRWITDDGNRVFFNSLQSLSPLDTNGAKDVYEWEREDKTSCPTTTPARRDRGCDYVLSGGTSTDYSYLIETDPLGENVFFATRAQLTPQDRDEKMDLYDARVRGGFAEASLACTGTGCQGVPPAPPSFSTPASTTFTGAGNFSPQRLTKGKSAAQGRAERLAKALKSCRAQRQHKKRAACEAQARRRYGPPYKARRSAQHSRQGRRS